tara:strand:- start:877 stop:1182 length:306 start_codon:yes stop_codon:yes gene_type:complete
MIMLVASLILNVLLVAYIVWLLRKMWFISESFGSIFDSLTHFSNHVKSIHELEMFYGDETLGGLMEHSKEVVADLKEFEMFYSEEETEEGETDGETEKEEE